jgi:phosphinothricin acetyltransferase
MRVRVGAMRRADWSRVNAIYREGIAGGDATFETEAPDWEAFERSHFSTCRLVARAGREVVGWAALSSVSSRCVYAGVAEVSVYVADAAQGRGVGRRLLQHLVRASEAAGVWTLQAGIFPENRTSLSLHGAFGFREVGVRERIGRHGGRWRDVIVLERRSPSVGVE